LGENVHYVPGYRPLDMDEIAPPHLAAPKESTEPLRLVFLGWVRAEKGVFVLLESLKKFGAREQRAIQCDIYGPIHPSIAQRFEKEVAEIACATYGGVLEPTQVIETLRTYDALVFPSFYQGEGHPGVVIEAMAAGIPVITTQFRSIPEVVEDRKNGLLVEPQNAKGLHRAILTVHTDRTLLWELAQRNWEARGQYEARNVAPQILQPILAGLAEQEPSSPLATTNPVSASHEESQR
jgi:glycosyltransferase involved in cell wall biosynthesis